MVERLVANEKVVGSSPIARSIIKVIKSSLITSIFQKYLINRDIRTFKGKFSYYIIFRLIRKLLTTDIIVSINNFKVFGSIKNNKTSYFLLKKCEFGDDLELETINKFSNKNKIMFIDCGCNYGFYSFYVASLSKKNFVISIEASRSTSEEFKKNLKLNDFENVILKNCAISNTDNDYVLFNESSNDWESSQIHKEFNSYTVNKVITLKIDTLIKNINIKDFLPIIKMDVEGNEMNVLKGATSFIESASPFIIIEISKYIFEDKNNVEYIKNFLQKYNYSIYNTNKKKVSIDNIMIKLNKLEDKYKTIGNYYLIKNFSKILKDFISDE